MRRYWIDSSQLKEDQVVFSGDHFHHIFDVCRQEVGSKFEVLLDSTAYFVEVISVGKKSAEARVHSRRPIPPLPRPHIHVALSLAKYQTMDAVVEKMVEMGVASFHPFFSDFSFIRKDSSFPQQKLERWKKIVVSATQQCGRGELMRILPPVHLKEIVDQINRTSGQLGLFSYEGPANKDIKSFIQAKKTSGITDVWCLIGSEGGFSTQEADSLQNLGFDPVTLGRQVLRVETACMTLVSVLKYEFELFSGAF